MSATRFSAFQSNQPHIHEYLVDVFRKWGSISAFVITMDMGVGTCTIDGIRQSSSKVQANDRSLAGTSVRNEEQANRLLTRDIMVI